MKSALLLFVFALTISQSAASFSDWCASVENSMYHFFTGKDLSSFGFNSSVADPIPDGNYTFFSAKYGSVFTSHKIDYFYDNVSYLFAKDHHHQHNQKFYIQTTDAHYYTITDLRTGLALTVQQNGSSGNLTFQPLSNAYEQQFLILRLRNESTFTIQPRSSMQYLTAHHRIRPQDGNGHFAQRWRVLNLNGTHPNRVHNGYYSFISKANGEALTIARKGLSKWSPLLHETYRMRGNQRFIVRAVDESFYTIVAEHSGLALTAPNLRHSAGNAVVQLPLKGDAHQQWKFVPRVNGTYSIENRLTGLDITDIGFRNGPSLQMIHKRRPNNKFYLLRTV